MADLKWRFVAVYVIVGVMLVIPYMLVVATWGHANTVARTEAKKAVAVAAGDQNLYAMCETAVTNSIEGSYGQITAPYKDVSIKHSGDTALVTITVTSNIYTGNAVCKFHQTNWQLQQVGPAK